MQNVTQASLDKHATWFRFEKCELIWNEYSEEEQEYLTRHTGSTTKGSWECSIPNIETEPELVAEMEGYDPLRDEPSLYLEFAALGRHAWEAFDGEYLDYPDYSREIPEDLATHVISFWLRFGPITIDVEEGRECLNSVFFTLKQAQIIYMLVTYNRLAESSTHIENLRNRIQAVRDNWHSYMHRIDRNDRPPWYRPDSPLNTPQSVKEAAEQFFLHESSKSTGVKGLHLRFTIQPMPALLDSSGWQFTFDFENLISEIWYQAISAIVKRSLIKACGNEACPEPDNLFVAERPNQIYCSTTCRNYNNTKKFRTRHRKQNADIKDLLP